MSRNEKVKEEMKSELQRILLDVAGITIEKLRDVVANQILELIQKERQELLEELEQDLKMDMITSHDRVSLVVWIRKHQLEQLQSPTGQIPKKNISQLRQYLNERTKKGLITNEEIETFLVDHPEDIGQFKKKIEADYAHWKKTHTSTWETDNLVGNMLGWSAKEVDGSGNCPLCGMTEDMHKVDQKIEKDRNGK